MKNKLISRILILIVLFSTLFSFCNLCMADENNTLTDRFQLIVNGQEIINGYSELVDSKEQEKRFLEPPKLDELYKVV